MTSYNLVTYRVCITQGSLKKQSCSLGVLDDLHSSLASA